MANRYVAGASGLPFAVLRGYNGTGLAGETATIMPITCPFTGEPLTAVAALNPDVAIIHAQQADRPGNVHSGGSPGSRRRRCSRPTRSVVTVEEVVDDLDPRPGAVVLPAWRSPTWPTCPTARTRPTRRATPIATTTSTWPGTRSRRDRETFGRLAGRERLRSDRGHPRRGINGRLTPPTR